MAVRPSSIFKFLSPNCGDYERQVLAQPRRPVKVWSQSNFGHGPLVWLAPTLEIGPCPVVARLWHHSPRLEPLSDTRFKPLCPRNIGFSFGRSAKSNLR